MGDYEEIMIMMGDNASFFCVFGHYTNSISMESVWQVGSACPHAAAAEWGQIALPPLADA